MKIWILGIGCGLVGWNCEFSRRVPHSCEYTVYKSSGEAMQNADRENEYTLWEVDISTPTAWWENEITVSKKNLLVAK